MPETNYNLVLRGYCPYCGRGKMFKGWIELHSTCPACGARFERWPGAWTGATVGGYGVGAVAACVTLFLLWSGGRLGEGSEYLVVLVAVTSVLLSYRHVKATWIGIIHSMGYVYPDPPTGQQPGTMDSEPPST